MTLRSLRGSFMVLCALLLLWLLPTNARAADVVASGYCGGEGDGTNLTRTLDDADTLSISGAGKMADYKYGTQPWYSYQDNLKALVIEEGVTSIGDTAFAFCYDLAGSLTIAVPADRQGDTWKIMLPDDGFLPVADALTG